MKFKPSDLPATPTPEQWKWWKRCFADRLRINGTTTDADKLVFLRTYVGADYFALLESATGYNEAIATLDKQFLKPTRVLFARHQALSARQKEDETVTKFFGRLKSLVENCGCSDLDIQQHKDYLARDALIAGLRSDTIRARLLELEDSRADIDSCVSLASAIELSTDFSKSFKSPEASVVAVADTNCATSTMSSTKPGTQRPKTSLICASSTQPGFPTMQIDPPVIFSPSVYKAKTIASKSRKHKIEDRNFVDTEVKRMIADGIITVSTSPWRAQAFVNRDHKPRMVIDYSETVNRYISKTRFPFRICKSSWTKQRRILYSPKST